MSTAKVLFDSAQVFPCALEEQGCETASVDRYAHIWDYPDNCVLSVLRTKIVKIVKQGTKLIVDPTRLLCSYFKTRTTQKSTVKNQRMFTQPNMAHFM